MKLCTKCAKNVAVGSLEGQLMCNPCVEKVGAALNTAFEVAHKLNLVNLQSDLQTAHEKVMHFLTSHAGKVQP